MHTYSIDDAGKHIPSVILLLSSDGSYSFVGITIYISRWVMLSNKTKEHEKLEIDLTRTDLIKYMQPQESSVAEYALRWLAHARGLDSKFKVDSTGTINYHEVYPWCSWRAVLECEDKSLGSLDLASTKTHSREDRIVPVPSPDSECF